MTADAAAGVITIDTSVASVDLTASGNIDVDATSAIVLTDVDTTDGTITVDAGVIITATDIGDGNNKAIALTTTSGDITSVNTVNAGTGTVTLDSAGAIDGATNDSTADVTGGVVNLTAASGGNWTDHCFGYRCGYFISSHYHC